MLVELQFPLGFSPKAPKLIPMLPDLIAYVLSHIPHLLVVGSFLLSIVVSLHVVLYKRDTSSVITWVGLAWLAPYLGAAAYFVLGVNRVQRSAEALGFPVGGDGYAPLALTSSEEERIEEFVHQYPQFVGQAALGATLSKHRLKPGNQVTPLRDGDEAYPDMLAAMAGARSSINLMSYIFDSDQAGDRFFDALCDAQRRGVEVRVLIDAVGARYSKVNMIKKLRQAGINAAAFLPTRLAGFMGYVNLRNHRKILVVDGHIAFTGGTNIRQDHWLKLLPDHPVKCLHFRFEGPVAAHLQEVFAVDWAYTCGESLHGELWFPERVRVGQSWCRGISHGPDEDFEKITYTIMGVLGIARHRVRIVTPYFIPGSGLIYALQLAAMRGLDVEIVLPEKNNIRLVQWASQPIYRHLLNKGCRLYHSAPPFDHTKLLLVDDAWSLLGSTNWDPRSLRLNFEFNVECYDELLAAELNAIVDEKIAGARQLSLDEVNSTHIARKVRNGLARVFSPYL